MTFTNILSIAIALITLILTVTIAFPEGRTWIKSKYLKLRSFTSTLSEKSTNRFSSLITVLVEVVFFLINEFLLLYFLSTPLLVAYFFIPSIQEITIKIYNEIALTSSELKALGFFVSIFLYFLSVIIFVNYKLNRKIDFLRNRVINLYSLKPIAEMTNEQRMLIFQVLRSNWKAMTLTIGADVYPNISGGYRLTERDYLRDEYVKVANLLEVCKPLSFEKGILLVECPNSSIQKQLLRHSFYVEKFLAKRIEYLTGFGYKEEYEEPIYYGISKVDLTVSRNKPQNVVAVKSNKKKDL